MIVLDGGKKVIFEFGVVEDIFQLDASFVSQIKEIIEHPEPSSDIKMEWLKSLNFMYEGIIKTETLLIE